MSPRVIGLVLALVSVLVFLPTTRNDFINYDDDLYVTGNPMVQKGLTAEGIVWAFSGWRICNWHPLTLVSHMIDCEVFRLNPAGHHLVNVLFHAANTALLFWLLLRLMGPAIKEGKNAISPVWISAFAAALFAWHPLRVESVAWVAERKDVLSIFFGLIAMLCYERSVRGPRPKLGFALSLTFFSLSLMSKAMLVTLPVIFLLLDFWPLQRIKYKGVAYLVSEKIPFFLVSGIFCVLTFFAQRSEAVVSLKRVAIGLRIENSLMAYVGYILKMIWPFDLAVFYPLPKQIPAVDFILASAAFIAISAGVFWFGRRRPYLWVGWIWYLIALLPVIGLVQVGDQAMADRYTYFPGIGICLIIAFVMSDIATHFELPLKWVGVFAGVILAACLFQTSIQVGYWRDSLTLFNHTASVTRNNALAHLNLGAAYHDVKQTSRALNEYQLALKMDPGRREAYHNIGRILSDEGRFDQAIEYCIAALQLDLNSPSAHDSLGIVQLQMGRYVDAATNFLEAIRIDSNYSPAYFQMGRLLLRRGDDFDAIKYFHIAIQKDPQNFQMLVYVARVLAAHLNPSVRDGRIAMEYANRAAALTSGEQSVVLDTLAMAEASNGNYQTAVRLVSRAIELSRAAGNQEDVDVLRQRLASYQDNQAWTQSFRDK